MTDHARGQTPGVIDAAIADGVAAARRRYAAARPVSAEWDRRAQEVLPGGNTRSVLHFDPFPFRVASAEGAHLTDVDGHRYVDLLGNYTAGLLGHSPAAVRDAVHAAVDRGWGLGAVGTDEVDLAALIVERFASIEQVRFTNSGTEANLMALGVAVHATGRRKVLAFEGGYHGGVATFAGHRELNVPHEWVVGTYNDVDGIAATFAEHGDELAAVLVEPMQGSAGCIPGDPEFLGALRAACDASGALLIFDEVMTSRLAPGGAQQLLGIDADLTTLGKYLAGGFGFGAFGGRCDLMAAFDPAAGGTLGHAGTFNNDVISMAAGVATLRDVLTPEVLRVVNERGERLREALADTFTRHDAPMSVTGVGSLMNIHATPGPVRTVDDLRSSVGGRRELLFFDALAAGYFLAPRGFIALSIEVTDDDLDGFLAVVDRWASTIAASG
jgi:glutamate-1-semialdehyde 2,1-aminomutase